jgi:hypothetical protein
MNDIEGASQPDPVPLITTKEFASQLSMAPQSIRKRWSQTGSYFGIKPKKLPNRFLAWPANSMDMLFSSKAKLKV